METRFVSSNINNCDLRGRLYAPVRCLYIRRIVYFLHTAVRRRLPVLIPYLGPIVICFHHRLSLSPVVGVAFLGCDLLLINDDCQSYWSGSILEIVLIRTPVNRRRQNSNLQRQVSQSSRFMMTSFSREVNEISV